MLLLIKTKRLSEIPIISNIYFKTALQGLLHMLENQREFYTKLDKKKIFILFSSKPWFYRSK